MTYAEQKIAEIYATSGLCGRELVVSTIRAIEALGGRVVFLEPSKELTPVLRAMSVTLDRKNVSYLDVWQAAISAAPKLGGE